MSDELKTPWSLSIKLNRSHLHVLNCAVELFRLVILIAASSERVIGRTVRGRRVACHGRYLGSFGLLPRPRRRRDGVLLHPAEALGRDAPQGRGGIEQAFTRR